MEIKTGLIGKNNGNLKTKDVKMNKTIKKVCHCEKCGNESEMIITCDLPDEFKDSENVSPSADKKIPGKETKKKVKGSAVCFHCGNEADIWLDI